MKTILQRRPPKKRQKNTSTSTYLTALSNRTVKKGSGAGGRQREKNEYIYLKLKKKNNIKTMVLKIYL